MQSTYKAPWQAKHRKKESCRHGTGINPHSSPPFFWEWRTLILHRWFVRHPVSYLWWLCLSSPQRYEKSSNCHSERSEESRKHHTLYYRDPSSLRSSGWQNDMELLFRYTHIIVELRVLRGEKNMNTQKKKREPASVAWFSLLKERKTRLELATLTLARLCSTNWAISALERFALSVISDLRVQRYSFSL